MKPFLVPVNPGTAGPALFYVPDGCGVRQAQLAAGRGEWLSFKCNDLADLCTAFA